MTLEGRGTGSKPRWKLRKGASLGNFSAGTVLQRTGRAGVLDLVVCVAGWANVPLLTPVAAGALSEAIRKDTGIISWLHWPDLVTIEGRVVGKVSVSPARDPNGAVIRVVVNCYGSLRPATSTVLPPSSIRDCLGVEIDTDLLREKVLEAVDWYSAEWERKVYSKLAARIEPSIPWMGETVEARTTRGAVITGKALGLDEAGSLVLQQTRCGGVPLLLQVDEVQSVLPVRQLTQPQSTRRTLL